MGVNTNETLNIDLAEFVSNLLIELLFFVPFHATPEEFENAVLFLRLGLPSTLIRHENSALFLRLGLPSTLIRHENAALFYG